MAVQVAAEWVSGVLGSIVILIVVVFGVFHCVHATPRCRTVCNLFLLWCLLWVSISLGIALLKLQGGPKSQERECVEYTGEFGCLVASPPFCGWCAPTRTCVAFDCKSVNVSSCPTQPETNEPCDLGLADRPSAHTQHAFGIVCIVAAAHVGVGLLVGLCYCASHPDVILTATEAGAAGFASVGCLWASLIYVGAMGIDDDVVPRTDLCHALLLGLTFIADFKKLLVHAQEADHKHNIVQRGVLMFSGIWIGTWIMVLLFTEGHDTSYAMLVNMGILSVDVALTYKAILAIRTTHVKVFRIVWITFTAITTFGVLVVGLVNDGEGDTLDAVMTAAVLVQQVMQPITKQRKVGGHSDEESGMSDRSHDNGAMSDDRSQDNGAMSDDRSHAAMADGSSDDTAELRPQTGHTYGTINAR